MAAFNGSLLTPPLAPPPTLVAGLSAAPAVAGALALDEADHDSDLFEAVADCSPLALPETLTSELDISLCKPRGLNFAFLCWRA